MTPEGRLWTVSTDPTGNYTATIGDQRGAGSQRVALGTSPPGDANSARLLGQATGAIVAGGRFVVTVSWLDGVSGGRWAQWATAVDPPFELGTPRRVRVGDATIQAPQRLSVAGFTTNRCVNVKVTSTSPRPMSVLVTIYSGRKSLRLFGKKRVRLGKPSSTTVCIPVPRRARTFRPRDGLTLDIRSAGLSRVGLRVTSVKRLPIGLAP